MEQSNVFEFDGFQIERESYLGGDCYGVVTSCKKDGAGIPYHLEVEFDISKARFSFSKYYAHEVVPCDELSVGGKLKIMAYLLEKVGRAYVQTKEVVQKMSMEKLKDFAQLFGDEWSVVVLNDGESISSISSGTADAHDFKVVLKK